MGELLAEARARIWPERGGKRIVRTAAAVKWAAEVDEEPYRNSGAEEAPFLTSPTPPLLSSNLATTKPLAVRAPLVCEAAYGGPPKPLLMTRRSIKSRRR